MGDQHTIKHSLLFDLQLSHPIRVHINNFENVTSTSLIKSVRRQCDINFKTRFQHIAYQNSQVAVECDLCAVNVHVQRAQPRVLGVGDSLPPVLHVYAILIYEKRYYF